MTIKSELTALDYKAYFEDAISYETYLSNFEGELNLGDESPYAQYLPQNWRRQSRLDRKFKLREDLLEAVGNIKSKLNWLVITEHWCGDASQINPIINKVAKESNGMIDLKFTYRDENEELINAHLTDGRSKSIPILLQFDEDFQLLNVYGPRPAVAQELVKSILSEGGAYSIPLHTWYAKDKQQSIQDDMINVLK